MKNIIIISISLLVSNISYSQKKMVEDSINVSGNCSMCKKRIETAIMAQNGVKYAEWNVKTKKLFIAYREDKISTEEVHKALAAAGHDTDLIKTEDLVYSDLPFCCLYRDHDPHGPNGEEKKHGNGHH